MNWLVIVLALILVWRIAEGIHRGMVKEIISFISLIVLCIAVALLGTALSNYFEKDVVSMVVAILLLLVLCIVHRLLGLVFFSAKVLSKLPVISAVDKLLGAVIGVLETVLIVWTIYSLILTLNMGMVGEQILQYAKGNSILEFLYRHNYIQQAVEAIAPKIGIVLKTL